MNKGKEPLVLKAVDFFVKPFLGKEINYNIVREILKLKLVLDKRRVPKMNGGNANPGKGKKEAEWSIWFICLMYLFLGIFIAGFQVIDNLFVANLFGYGALIFMLLTVYIGEYSAVLLDTTEKPFFGSLPVGKKELRIAKDIHIAYYIGAIAVSMMIPSIVIAVIFHGILYGSLYFLVGLVIVVFCLHLAGSLYYLLLKVFSGERLKDILNAFQVFVTIALVLSYQILPRLISFKDLEKLDLNFNYFLFVVPSAWFASFFSIVFEWKTDFYYFGLTAVAILAVSLLEFVYKKKILKEFDGELEKLTEEAKENKSLGAFSRLLCKLLSKDRQEKAFMELVQIQISRDRNLKLKLYPQLANVVIIPILIVFSGVQNKGITELMEKMKTEPYYLALYMVGLTSAGIYTLIGQAENKESKLFYQILPIANLSKCIRAGVKIVIFKYLTPIFLLMSAFFIAVSGFGILFDIVIIYMAFLFVTGLMIRMNAWVLPFTTETVAGNVGYNLLMFFMNFVVSGVIGFIHFMFLKTLLLKGLAFVVFVAANFVLWKFFMNKRYVIERG